MLIGTRNNHGAETVIRYAASTKFYLADKAAGTPWATRLPFPVHVVEQVEARDRVTRRRVVSRYRYRHGYYDGHEREFRGFGMVEQTDTEAFEGYVVGVIAEGGTQELAPELNQPPITTRTWFHTGALIDPGYLARVYEREIYGQRYNLPGPRLPTAVDGAELREAVRALTGLPLRQEVYSFDGSAMQSHPYVVVDNNYEVRVLQRRGARRHGVFLPTSRETLSLSYERNPTDPRVAHSFRLEVDDYGNTVRSCLVAYGRRQVDPALPAEVTRDQRQRHITYAEASYTADIDRNLPAPAYRLRLPFESSSFEITGIAPAGERFELEELRALISTTTLIDYDMDPDGVTPQQRPLARERVTFLDDALQPLPRGQWDSLGLGHRRFRQAFTDGTIATQYAGAIGAADLIAAGYLQLDGDSVWWIPSGTKIYPAQPAAHFYIPVGDRDALGIETNATLDRYDLLTERIEVTQATWNVTTSINDYRVLAPVMLTDPNHNRSAVAHDALGVVVRTAVMGKAGATEGDTLADPTTRTEYALFNWIDHGGPNFVRTLAREVHGSAATRWQESYSYFAGSGSIAMIKARAHPGRAFSVDENGGRIEVLADPRWIGNGRTIVNNKGNPVKQYEPYYSATHAYEDESVLREIGVTTIHYYDSAGRNVRTSFPNGTFARTEIGAWSQASFDANDTVLESAWYRDRGSPDPATDPEPLSDPERRAAWLAAKHASTPAITHFDSLGRPSYSMSDHGGGVTSAVRAESDLTGRTSRVFDAMQRQVATGFVAMHGAELWSTSAEKGRRWTFQNIVGAPLRSWDEHGRSFRLQYDALNRPLGTIVESPGVGPVLYHYLVYGDRVPNAHQLNLLGGVQQSSDQSGMVRVPALDFKGNPLSVERVLAREYSSTLDWTALASQTDYAALRAATASALDTSEVFTASAELDALNRPMRVVLPDGTVLLPVYNESGFLASLRAQLRGSGPLRNFLEDQDYDAKGQRLFARYGNDVLTRYFYDPTTFRLTNLLTHRAGADTAARSLQNLHYTYDPVGNVTGVRDEAQQAHFFANAVVGAESRYEYDAVYQLTRATGRELAGLTNDVAPDHGDLSPARPIPHVNDLAAVRNYTDSYEYDLLGNIKVVRHRHQPTPGGSGWTRHYRYAFEDDPTNATNRLRATSLPGDPEAGPYTGPYDHDAYGNMTRMPHLASLGWDVMDRLRFADLGGGGSAHYVYELGGTRVRKVIERGGDLNLEWIFLGAVMLFRRRRRSSGATRF